MITGEATLGELRLGRFHDVGITGPAAGSLDQAYRDAQHAIWLKTGARALVAGIRRSGRRVVILTNFSGDTSAQHDKIDRLGIRDEVDAVVVTGDIGIHKPDPRAFLTALERVGGRPEAAAMVGDNLHTDIEGALAAGFARAVWLTRRKFRPADPRVRIAAGVREVMAALEP